MRLKDYYTKRNTISIYKYFRSFVDNPKLIDTGFNFCRKVCKNIKLKLPDINMEINEIHSICTMKHYRIENIHFNSSYPEVQAVI